MGLVSLERVHQTVQSWREHTSHANTYRLRTQLLQKFATCRPSIGSAGIDFASPTFQSGA